jgi:hypothetical protein
LALATFVNSATNVAICSQRTTTSTITVSADIAMTVSGVSLSLTAGSTNVGTININTTSITTNGGALTFTGNVVIAAGRLASFDTTNAGAAATGGAITVTGNINGTAAGAIETLTLNSGQQAISIGGGVFGAGGVASATGLTTVTITRSAAATSTAGVFGKMPGRVGDTPIPGAGSWADGRVAVYMGDDDNFEYVYRFVSEGTYDPANPASGKDLLDAGTLSVAVYNADGTMNWLPLVHGQGPLTAENGFATQAEVLLKTRMAADALGATPMDRPEDMETNPVTGRVYAIMTKNKKMTADKLNPANTRPENFWGHIVEMIPPGGVGAEADHTADSYTWDLFVLAGNPKDPATGSTFHPATTDNGWFVTPDNLTFDPKGRMFVATDGANDFDIPDGIYGVDTEGPARGLPKLLFTCPMGAEATGPCFTPDGSTLFVAVQHPAEDSDTLADATTRWPDFTGTNVPRPAVVAIQRLDGMDVAS